MLNIEKQDILKTVLIFWFVTATSYFIYDQYFDYKIKGIQESYQAGYGAAIDDLIKKAKESQCRAFDVTKNNDKVSLTSTDCFQQPPQQTTSSAPTNSGKK